MVKYYHGQIVLLCLISLILFAGKLRSLDQRIIYLSWFKFILLKPKMG
jgi:hypothetical protein